MELLDQLYKRVQDELFVYQALLGCIAREKEALLYAKTDELKDILSEKSSLLEKIKLAQFERESLFDDIKFQEKCEDDITTLSHLKPLFPDYPFEKFDQMEQETKRLIHEVRFQNESNHVLASNALKGVEGVLNNFKESLAGKSTYERKGKMKSSKQVTGSFVKRQV